MTKNPDKSGGVVHGIVTPVGVGHNPKNINKYVIKPKIGLINTHGISNVTFIITGNPKTIGSEIQNIAGTAATFPVLGTMSRFRTT